MPQVPVYGSPQVQESALPNVRFGAETNLDTFGGGKPLEAAGEAIQGVEKTAFDITQQEKQKADNLAFMSADRQASELQTQLQVNTSKMLGRDALVAPDYVQQQWSDGLQKIQGSLQNDTQRMAFAKAANTRWEELNKTTQVHVSQQMQAFDDNETAGYLATSRNAAVLNATDDQKVEFELARQQAALTDWAQRKGIPTDSDAFKAKLADQLSGTHKEIIAARLDKDDPNNVEQARDYLDAHKSQMNSQDLVAATKAIDQAETTGIALDAWDDVKNMKLSNGMPDEARMQKALYSRDDLSDERKEKVWEFVKGRAKEEVLQKNMQDQSTDRSFMNAAIQARQQGAPLQDALKLADRYSSDPYDQSVKANAIRQIYAPPTKSDPSTFMNIWESIQDGTAEKSDIDQALNKQQLTTEDWRSLRMQYYKSNTEDQSAEEKQTWERIKLLSEETFSDKKKRDAFMYEMHSISDGKSPEDLWKSANDKLKTAPGSGIFGTDWFGEPQWKTDIQKSDAQNTAWGKVYQDVGDSETKAIGQGILYSGKESWGLGDVDAFAAQFGGYDKIKGGTPVNTAIQSLMSHGKLATAANVKAVLKKYPDGKY